MAPKPPGPETRGETGYGKEKKREDGNKNGADAGEDGIVTPRAPGSEGARDVREIVERDARATQVRGPPRHLA